MLTNDVCLATDVIGFRAASARSSAFPATTTSSPSASCCGRHGGAISLEVFGQYGADTLTDPAAVFDTQMRLLVGLLTQH